MRNDSVKRLMTLVVMSLAFIPGSLAHIDYVYEEPVEMTTAALLSSITDPVSLALLVGLPIVIISALVFLHRSGLFRRDIAVLEDALDDDRSFVPLILRLSMGVPLIGAGFQQYLFTPAVPFQHRIVLVFVGFSLLFGLATRFIAGITLLFYLVMLTQHHALLLAFEFVPGLLSIIVLGSGRPSIDQLLTELSRHEGTIYSHVDPVYGGLVKPFASWITPYQRFVPVILRAGLGIALIYLGIGQKLLRPGVALSVVEKYGLTAIVPVSPELWVIGAAVVEVAVGIILLLGIWTRLAAAVLFGLFSLTLFGLPDDPVLPHTSLFGLIAVLLILGAGPFSVPAKNVSLPELVED